jgi:hypothetical protein
LSTGGFITPALLSTPFGRVGDRGDVFLTQLGVSFLQQLFTIATSGDVNYLESARPRETGDSPVSWTPTLSGASTTGAPTYVTQSGFTAKIGPCVFAAFQLTISAVGGMVGNLQVGGFPFVANASGPAQSGAVASFGAVTLTAGYTQVGLEIAAGAQVANLIQTGSAQTAAPVTASQLGAAFQTIGSLLYFT